jgi:hypothetical protein
VAKAPNLDSQNVIWWQGWGGGWVGGMEEWDLTHEWQFVTYYMPGSENGYRLGSYFWCPINNQDSYRN